MTERRLTGMQLICKICGGMTFTDKDGKKITWVWDYARDCAVREEDMKAEQRAASERKKFERLRAKMDQGDLL